jgi:hypothetical protein
MEVLSVAKASASHIDRKGLRDDAPAREGQEGRLEISWSLWRDLGGVAVQGLDGLLRRSKVGRGRRFLDP